MGSLFEHLHGFVGANGRKARCVLTDAELLRRVQAGDVSAWEQLYERCLRTVWRYVYLQVGGERHLAEDVVGETIMALVRQVSSLSPNEGSLSGWLITVARHKLSDHRRSTGRGARVAEVLEAGDGGGLACASSTTWLEAAEKREQVVKVMDRLPEEERLVLEWKYLEELSVGEIASRLGRTEKAAESALYRARRSFRSLFMSLFGEPL